MNPLGYLFDSSTHAGKAVFEMSAGCLRVDQDGYYYYNSNNNYAYYDREHGGGGVEEHFRYIIPGA